MDYLRNIQFTNNLSACQDGFNTRRILQEVKFKTT